MNEGGKESEESFRVLHTYLAQDSCSEVSTHRINSFFSPSPANAKSAKLLQILTKRFSLKNPFVTVPMSRNALGVNRALMLGFSRRLKGVKSETGMDPREGGVVAELHGRGCEALNKE